jgi:predicted nuclease of restriction endonuclease-like (RecB) superfamily
MRTSRRITRSASKSRSSPLPEDYSLVLADLKQMVRAARLRSLSAVNRELVLLYWQVGRSIVLKQEQSAWGDSVVEQLSTDLRSEFRDMRGLTPTGLWRMRQFYKVCRDIDAWTVAKLAPPPDADSAEPSDPILATLSRELTPRLCQLLGSVSWSHHCLIMAASDRPDERFFYLNMAVRERWSVRELHRQIESDLFTRYVSVKRDPEKCLPQRTESGEELLPFKDHYILDFLGLEDHHTERQLRKAMLANLRGVFLEFGRDFALVGEEHPIAVGDETYRIDLLFFHRKLQCLVAVELKSGKFKPEYIGKCQFYLAALDEFVRLPHEKPSARLVLCKSAGGEVQMRLALTLAARRLGVATYQTALPDEEMIVRQMGGALASMDVEMDASESEGREE